MREDHRARVAEAQRISVNLSAQCDSALDILVGSRELAHPAQRLCLRAVGACEHRGILCAFGDRQLPLAKLARRIKLEPQYVMELQPIADPEELFTAADALTERTRAIDNRTDLR